MEVATRSPIVGKVVSGGLATDYCSAKNAELKRTLSLSDYTDFRRVVSQAW